MSPWFTVVSGLAQGAKPPAKVDAAVTVRVVVTARLQVVDPVGSTTTVSQGRTVVRPPGPTAVRLAPTVQLLTVKLLLVRLGSPLLLATRV